MKSTERQRSNKKENIMKTKRTLTLAAVLIALAALMTLGSFAARGRCMPRT
jgi:hypothetical protein